MPKNSKTTIKKIVKSNFERMGNLTIDELIEVIRPHYKFDRNKLVESELRRKV
jgi:DNA topoisomerase VI subunit B